MSTPEEVYRSFYERPEVAPELTIEELGATAVKAEYDRFANLPPYAKEDLEFTRQEVARLLTYKPTTRLRPLDSMTPHEISEPEI